METQLQKSNLADQVLIARYLIPINITLANADLVPAINFFPNTNTIEQKFPELISPVQP
jgi:hypothetical protein